MHDVPELAAGNVVPRRRRIRATPILEAHLHDARILPRGLDHLASFPDGHRRVLLDVNVLARLAGPDGGQRVPVFRRGDDHGVHLLVVEGDPHVSNALRGALLQVGQFRHEARAAVVPDIADIFEFHPGQPRHGHGMSRPPPAGTDQCQHDFIARTLRPGTLGSTEQRSPCG